MCRAYPTGWYVLHGAHPSQRDTVDAEDLADARQLAPCHWRTASGPQGSKRGVDRRYYDAADSYLINGTFRARATVFTRVEADAAAVWARGADVDWPGAAATPLLRGVDLEVPRGALCAVVGETGAGKSGLLASLLGETVCARGSLGVEGSVAYAAQSAWIQNATLRANVLFGQPMDRARYDETIRRCSLTADLAALADGDLTEIGEKGLTLSGGQKQRVALARAFYADADVYLLDDCLSAVDAHVAAALFDDLVLHLRDELRRTVVLVTHNLSTLRKCDAVVCLGAGSRTVDYAGPPEGFLDLGRADPERYPLAAIAARQKRSTSGEHLSALAGDEAEAKEQDKTATMDAEKKPPRATAAEQREKGTISAATRRTYLMATGGSAMALLVVCAQIVYLSLIHI